MLTAVTIRAELDLIDDRGVPDADLTADQWEALGELRTLLEEAGRAGDDAEAQTTRRAIKLQLVDSQRKVKVDKRPRHSIARLLVGLAESHCS
jgi:hypothetical protein